MLEVPIGTIAVAPTVSTPMLVSGMALSTAGSMYKSAVELQQTSDQFAVAARSLRGLPEKDQFREGIFLSVLSQIVDDPNKTNGACHWAQPVSADPIDNSRTIQGDPFDANGNGNTTEQIPCVQYWIDRRITKIKQGVREIGVQTQQFLDPAGGPLATFQTQTEAVTQPGGLLSRQEIEGSDGPLIALARALEVPASRTPPSNSQAFRVSFWDSGMTTANLTAWHEADCDDCQAPAEFQEVDLAADTMDSMTEISQTLRDQSVDDATVTADSWLPMLTDPNDGDNVDANLQVVADGDATLSQPITGLRGWQDELIAIRDRQLPACELSHTGVAVVIDNSPCAVSQGRKGEFGRELANVDAFLAMIDGNGVVLSGSPLEQDLTQRIAATSGSSAAVRLITIANVALANGVITYEYEYCLEGGPCVSSEGGGGGGGGGESGSTDIGPSDNDNGNVVAPQPESGAAND